MNLDEKKQQSLETNERLILNLRNLGHGLRFLYEGKASQKRILIVLLENGPMTQRILTNRLGIQPGSASEVIGKLEAAELILRMPSEQDRRTAIIQLTEKGHQEAEKALKERIQRHQEMFSCMTEEEKESLINLTKKLLDDWNIRYRTRLQEAAAHRKKHRH